MTLLPDASENQTGSEIELKLYHVFRDETCQERHRWMALGTLVVPDEHLNDVRSKFTAMKSAMGLQGEIKWEYTNKKLLSRYKRLANAAFSLISKHKVMQFHAMLICMDVVDHEKYNDGIPDLSYSRFFHHLMLKYIKLYGKNTKYYVLFDERNSKVPMRPFQNSANFAAHRNYNIDHWPFRRLQYQNSKADILFQINDLILGAIGFLRNRKHVLESTKSSPKAELALHIRRSSPARSFWQDTSEHKLDFTLWALRFGGRKGKDAFRNRKKSTSKSRNKSKRRGRSA
ncbi:DUF3800 domain-containing protein [Methylobacterium mesophilicum]|uniref:DUF3800 domain-containing protein n=1 Tax=Methylobacterium mesophilicum TaxID=39956 RepID=UPI002F346046